MIRITHEQLRVLQPCRGQLDRDSGRVFLGVRGAMNISDRLYYLEDLWRPLTEGDQLATFSMSEVLGQSPAEIETAGPDPAAPIAGGCCS